MLVEVALVTPFLLLLSAGVFEFSQIIHDRMSIEVGVESVARYVARCSSPDSAKWATCVSTAKDLAVASTSIGTGWEASDIVVTPCAVPTVVPAPVESPAVSLCENLTAATDATLYRSESDYLYVVDVSASVAYDGSGLWAFLGFGALNISASHQERIVGS